MVFAPRFHDERWRHELESSRCGAGTHA